MSKEYFPRMLLAAALALAVLSAPPPAAAQTSKKPVNELVEELDLTYVQVMDLKHVFEVYREKMDDLAAEADTLEPVMVEEKKQRLQREYYEELIRILTPEQLEKYQDMVKEDATPKQIEGKKNATLTVFPWVKNIRRASQAVVASGLQRQAMDGLFKEIESRANQTLYWDNTYDPAEDPSMTELLETKLSWILTEDQYNDFTESLDTQFMDNPAPDKDNGAAPPKNLAPESGIE